MLKKFTAICVAIFLVVGCAEATQVSKEEMSAAIRADLAKQSGKPVKEVTLVRESDHTLKGIATYADGKTTEVTVTVDNDQYMWKYPSGLGQ